MARIAVPVVPAEGGHQAVCRTPSCAWAGEDSPWRSEVHTVKAGAEDDARIHRQWHRSQRPVPDSIEVADA